MSWKSIFILISFLSFNSFIYSQVWIARYNGEANSDDCAVDLAVDEQGNVYVTGYSYDLTSRRVYLTIKYNPNGETLWTRSYQGIGHSEAKGLVIDSEGNVYVTGWSYGASSYRDILTIKYNVSGQVLWSRSYNSPNNQDDEPTKMVIDSRDNIYITGFSFNTLSNYDYVTIKYDKNGIERWVSSYNGPGDSIDKANSVTVDREGNVYVTGLSYGFGTRGDFATIKYDSLGGLIWLIRHDDSLNLLDDEAIGIGLDSFNNIYVSGLTSSEENPPFLTFTVIKYSSLGEERWKVKSIPGVSDDILYTITVDYNGNIYLTGGFCEWLFSYEYLTELYDSSGQRIWWASYGVDTVCDDISYGLTIDNTGNVYVTGKSPTRLTRSDYATIKYNRYGVEQWIARYNGPGNYHDEAYAITIDRTGNVYVTGRSYGLNSSYDYCTIKYPPSGPGIGEERLTQNAERLTFEINPNPAKSVIRVRGPLIMKEIRIFDVTGKLVKEEKVTSPQERKQEVIISLKGINPGIYLLEIGKEDKKFIVVR